PLRPEASGVLASLPGVGPAPEGDPGPLSRADQALVHRPSGPLRSLFTIQGANLCPEQQPAQALTLGDDATAASPWHR
ncbi:MAG: hypothetical protein ACRDJG_02570, partial [Actinomycetota bacterium]